MIDLCRQSGFHGWYGIESGGRAAIKKAIRTLKGRASIALPEGSYIESIPEHLRFKPGQTGPGSSP